MNALALINEDTWGNLSHDLRLELSSIINHLPVLIAAVGNRKLHPVCAEIASSIPGMTQSSLYRRVSQYSKTGDPLTLVNRRACSSLWKVKEDRDNLPLPVAFKQFVCGILERHQRNHAEGIQEVMAIWRTQRDADGKFYEALPGYDEWPDAHPAFGHPIGWSKRNLYRCAPDDFDALAARVGMHAAAQYRVPVLTTRVGLKVGERVEFDDHEYNLKIVMPGQNKLLRPRGFTCADCLSGFLIPVFKPTLWDHDAEKKKTIGERDFRWFIVHYLSTVGYRTDAAGTTFVVEHGTATIRPDFAGRIKTATNDKVKIAMGAMFTDSAHGGQFAPKGRGNFHFKPLVESAFSKVDNKFARLPGQVGKDRDHSPAHLAGMETYTQRLLADLTRLSPERAANLRSPALTWSQFFFAALDLYALINADREHNLEGWSKLGFEEAIWRFDDSIPWEQALPMDRFLALPEEKQALVRAMFDVNPNLTRARKLSREDVWKRGQSELTTVPPNLFCALIGMDGGVEVKVGTKHPGLFTIMEKEFAANPVHFLAMGRDGRQFRNGEKFLGFFNPFNPSVLQLCKPNGEHVALCDAWHVPSKNDEEGVRRQMGKQSAWLTARSERMAARHLDETLARQDLVAHNAAVIAGEPVTAEEQERATQIKDNVRTMGKSAAQDILSPVGQPETIVTETPSDAGDDLLDALR